MIQLDDKFVILFCEGLTKPIDVEFAKVRGDIYEDIREKKQRLAMGEYFEHLQESATVDNYLASTSRAPAKTNPSGPQSASAVPAVYGQPPRR